MLISIIYTIIAITLIGLSHAWVSSVIWQKRIIRLEKLRDCINLSNDAAQKAQIEIELIHSVCNVGVTHAGFLRLTILDRFNNVVYDTDNSMSILDENFLKTLQTIFDKAVPGRATILKRSLIDMMLNRQTVGVALIPIFENNQAALMMCAIVKDNTFLDEEHQNILKGFASNIEMGFKTIALEKVSAAAHRRNRLMKTAFQESEEGFAIINQQGKIIESNETYCTINRLHPAKAIGTIINEFLNQDLLNSIMSKISHGYPWIGKRVVINNNGLPQQYWVKIVPGANEVGREYLVKMTRLTVHTESHNEGTLQNKDLVMMEIDIANSIKNNELYLYFQPQVDMSSKTVIGYEALIRWQHPSFGIISPYKFIPIAEKSGFIVEMGHWIIREACRQIDQWKTEGGNNIKVAINISPIQLHDRELVQVIRDAMYLHNVDPKELEIEITESHVMDNEELALSLLNEINKYGISISIDDFGVGHSSLACLRRLPVSKLKIDKSFTESLPHDTASAAIVKAIILMAKELNINVLAEGVENTDQESYLMSNGCYFAQGRLFGMPEQASVTN